MKKTIKGLNIPVFLLQYDLKRRLDKHGRSTMMPDLEQGKQLKLEVLHERMENLVELLDSLDPEKTGVEDIDRLIEMLDDLENQCKQYRQQAD
ncbi:SE1561 family protein [Salipaludibacillus agaradhaerens]|jgi:hypothetical protein|nr:SE1561 family protein [Salipaludibacillus agaradhaerens]